MLPKERVAAVFEHQPTDRIPIYHASLSSDVASYVLGREAYTGGGIQQYREAVALWKGGDAQAEFVERSFTDACEVGEKLDLDVVRTIHWRKPQKPSRKIDENTFMYGEPDKGEHWEVWHFDPPTETYGKVDAKPAPEPTPDQLAEQAERAAQAAEDYEPTPDDLPPDVHRSIARFGDTRAMYAMGVGSVGICIPRERVWLEATVLYPDIVGRYLDAAAIRGPKNAKLAAQMGIPYCFGGGDFTGTRGPMYSPQVFHDLMLPRLKIITEGCEKAGTYHLFASDGDLWPIADDLFGEARTHGFYEVDRMFMDLRELRERFPHLTLLGGIRSEVLHIGTVAEVIEETRTALEAAHECGSMIIGCSNQIVAGTPEENFWAMTETLEEER